MGIDVHIGLAAENKVSQGTGLFALKRTEIPVYINMRGGAAPKGILAGALCVFAGNGTVRIGAGYNNQSVIAQFLRVGSKVGYQVVGNGSQTLPVSGIIVLKAVDGKVNKQRLFVLAVCRGDDIAFQIAILYGFAINHLGHMVVV